MSASSSEWTDLKVRSRQPVGRLQRLGCGAKLELATAWGLPVYPGAFAMGIIPDELVKELVREAKQRLAQAAEEARAEVCDVDVETRAVEGSPPPCSWRPPRTPPGWSARAASVDSASSCSDPSATSAPITHRARW